MGFYERLESLRKSRKISQATLEKELGFSNGSVSKWKNSTPTPDRMKKLAEYFGVSVEWLITGENPDRYYLNDETAKVAQEIFENKELRVLFDAARDAKPEDLKTTYDMLMALKRKERGEDDDTGC